MMMTMPRRLLRSIRCARVSNVRGKVLETRSVFGAIGDTGLLREAFYLEIGPYIRHGAHSRSRLSRLSYSQKYFPTLRTQLPPAASGVVQTLEELCDQRRQFDLQSRLHFWLHAWLWIHLPLSIMLVLLMFVHIFVGLKYW